MTLCRLHQLRYPILAAAIGFSAPVVAIQTTELVQSAISTDCLEYQVVGVCFWLMCTNWGCSVETSIKVRHFIPETVVSSYQNTGENPWEEVASYSSPTSDAEQGGSGTTNFKRENEMSVFKNVDVVGHPGTMLNEFMNSTGYICKSATTAYMPYFLSVQDSTAWRDGIPEMAYPQSLIPGMREVGGILQANTWGNVYPRQGFLHQSDDYKASAVMAQRAGDIVTRTWQPHVYWPITASYEDGYWPPEPIVEGDITNHKWQDLVPTLRDTCAIFPNTNQHTQSTDGGYAWALWRPYSCCKREGQVFLGSVDFVQTGSGAGGGGGDGSDGSDDGSGSQSGPSGSMGSSGPGGGAGLGGGVGGSN